MFDRLWNRRVPLTRHILVAGAAMAVISGCAVIPKGQRTAPPPPPSRNTAGTLPQDQARHRVALLVPLSGPNAGVGQSIANAATMAVLDTNAGNLRITNYDTGSDPAAAAARAVSDGNELILGPLMAGEVDAVAHAARPAHIPVISFSNDAAAAGRDVFVMGSLPGQSIARTVSYAAGQGSRRFAALVPSGEYGSRAAPALAAAVRDAGGSVVATEAYERGNTSVGSAAHRLAAKGGYDAVMILDGGRIARLAAPQLKVAAAPAHVLGTELWSGDAALLTAPALRGAWFSALPDTRFRQFSASYKTRFGAQPYRLATMGYDAVLLTLRIARDWTGSGPFPVGRLTDPSGFLGLDGPFRFMRNGLIERAFEVREVRAGGVTVVSPAPSGFGG